MVRSTFAKVMPLVAAVVVGVAPPVASATPGEIVMMAADGRELSVGSLVTQGTYDGTTCVFPPDASRVTVLAPEGVDVSVALSATGSCALVVSSMATDGAPVDVAVGDPGVATGDPLVDRPKVRREPSSGDTAPTSIGGVTGGVRVGGALPGIGDVAAAAGVQTVNVNVRHTVYSTYVDEDRNTVEYQDYWTMEYLRDTKHKTVYGADVIHGGCRAGMKATFFVNPDNQRCWYENRSRPGVVRFHSGGTYVKMYGPLGWDDRVLTETYEATYDRMTRRECDAGATLPPGWQARCRWAISS